MADVFISCGFNPDERILGDWCYEYLTFVNISAFWGGVTASAYSADDVIKSEMGQCKFVVAFLHRRDKLKGNSNWTMPPGVRDELSYASSFQRPVIAFREKGVKINGLLSQRMIPQFVFDRSNPYTIEQVLPQYIENLQSQDDNNDNSVLSKVILAGLAGYLWGKWSK